MRTYSPVTEVLNLSALPKVFVAFFGAKSKRFSACIILGVGRRNTRINLCVVMVGLFKPLHPVPPERRCCPDILGVSTSERKRLL